MAKRSLMSVSGTGRTLSMFSAAVKFFTTSDTWRVHADDAEYAIYVEVGTSSHRAQPYMGPALDSVRSRVGSILFGAGSLDDGLELLAKEIEREAKERCPVRTGHLQASVTAERVE